MHPPSLTVQLGNTMEDQHGVISIHTTLTALSVAVGRLEEQMKAVREDLLYHTKNEHKSFEQALEAVEEIKSNLNRLQGLEDQRSGAWLALTKIGGLLVLIIAAGAWLVDHFLRR